MVGRLFLSGGGDEKQTYKIDEEFLRGVEKILYIPIAWKDGDYESCKRWFSNAMGMHKKVHITTLTELSNAPSLEDYDAVYVGGGNTFKLLDEMKRFNFDDKLHKYFLNGGTVYGGSAGAIIWGNDINIALYCEDADENKVNLKDTKGINVVSNCDVQCHFFDNQEKEHLDYVDENNRNVVALPEESALLISKDGSKVIGDKPVTLFTRGKIKKFEVGENFNMSY
ncbi:peptidase [Candidatus Pacearchaeota archaeon]|nr:peptidase [Candidatus Pacearchaeota archaeon]|tara:strand:- start:2400 stop:3074 length:675 start_codon:yes stop_codon:yes gene_type:complete